MISRKYTVKDDEGKEIVFRVYPNQKNLIVSIKDEIDLPLKTRSILLNIIEDINKFMDGNTINKVTVKEETE